MLRLSLFIGLFDTYLSMWRAACERKGGHDSSHLLLTYSKQPSKRLLLTITSCKQAREYALLYVIYLFIVMDPFEMKKPSAPIVHPLFVNPLENEHLKL